MVFIILSTSDATNTVYFLYNYDPDIFLGRGKSHCPQGNLQFIVQGERRRKTPSALPKILTLTDFPHQGAFSQATA